MLLLMFETCISLTVCNKTHFLDFKVWPLCRFPDARYSDVEQNKNVQEFSCSAEHIIIQWVKPLTTFCSTSHLCSVFAVITIGAKDQGCRESKSPNLHSLPSWEEQCLLLLRATQHRRLGWTLKWHKVKTIATDQWRWWPEHFDWWGMSDVTAHTISGSQEVNRMCAKRNRR